MLLGSQSLELSQILPYAIPLILAYPLLVSLLRFRRVQHLHGKYNRYTSGASPLGGMTDDEAFDIQKHLIQLEFPFIYIKALQFALFRVRPRPRPSLQYSANHPARHTASPQSHTPSRTQASSRNQEPP